MNRIIILAFVVTIFGTSMHAKHQQSPDIKELWEATASWTREYLVDVCASVPNAAEAQKQLIAHHAEVADAFKPYYSNKITKEFSDLLVKQANLTIDLIHAITTDDTAQQTELEKAWKAHACTLSMFLSNFNAYINFNVLRDMLYDYLALTITMITDRAHKQWKKDLQDYEKVRTQNEALANLLAESLDKAFPKRKKERTSSISLYQSKPTTTSMPQ